MDQLNEALLTLDPEDDAHWTEDGLPVVQVVADMVGDEDLTREQITDAAPTFGREALRTLQSQAEMLGEPEMPTTTEPEVALDAQMRDIDNEIESLYEEQTAIQAKITAAQRKRSQLAEVAAKNRNEGTNQEAIRSYITRSTKDRAKRVNARKQLLGNGLAGSPFEAARIAQGQQKNVQPLRHP